MSKWTGKYAVVTGASSGVGKAVSIEFAKNGIHVVGLARKPDIIEQYAEKMNDLSGKIYAIACDVSSLDSVKSAFDWIEQKFGSISICVNNAGINMRGNILDNLDNENYDRQLVSIIETNVNGMIYCSRQAYRLMKKSNDYGMIINISSFHANSIPFSNGLNTYSLSKSSVTALSETLRRELVFEKNDKIRISNVSPGCIKSNMMINSINSGWTENEKSRDELFESMPYLEPENIANAILYLIETPHNVNITELTIKPTGERL